MSVLKISDVIKRLQAILETDGDLPVMTLDADYEPEAVLDTQVSTIVTVDSVEYVEYGMSDEESEKPIYKAAILRYAY